MLRREFIHSGLLTIGALTAARWGFSALPSFQGGKVYMITDSVGYFTERGGTIGFHLSDEGISVVDAQYPESALHLIAKLKLKRIPFRMLINTHHHHDHTAGNISFKPLLSRLIAHENSLANQRRVAEKDHKTELQFFPNETFSDGWSEKAGTETISIHYFGPAHTDGDAIIHFENNDIVHVGDLVFNRTYPYIDRTAGANIENWISVLQRLQSNYPRSTRFICGHAGNGFSVTGGKDMIGYFQNYLDAALDFVRKSIARGASREETLQSPAIPGFADWKGEGIGRTLAAAFDELTQK